MRWRHSRWGKWFVFRIQGNELPAPRWQALMMLVAGLWLALWLLLPITPAGAQEPPAPTGERLPIDLTPAMGPQSGSSGTGESGPLPLPEPDETDAEGMDASSGAAGRPAENDKLPFSLQPAMGDAAGGEAARKPAAPQAKPDAAQAESAPAPAPAKPATKPADPLPLPPPPEPTTAGVEKDTAAEPAVADAPATGGTTPPTIVNVVPHFLITGMLAGIVLALLLVSLASLTRRFSHQLIGAVLFSLGAALFVMAWPGGLMVLPVAPLSLPMSFRLAALAETLMAFGAGWWLVAWLGAPESRAMRFVLMVLAGFGLSVVLLSPVFPASLLPLPRLAILLLALVGYGALLWPGTSGQRHWLGHLVLAGLLVWGVVALLFTFNLLSTSSAGAVLATAAGIALLTFLLTLTAMASVTAPSAPAGTSLALAGADAIPFRYEPSTARLHVPMALARRLHLPPEVFDTMDGFVTLAHPQDRPLLEAALRAATLDEPIALTMRLADAEGAWRAFRLQARALQPEKDAPRVIAGLLMEVDEHVAAPLPTDAAAGALQAAGSDSLHDPLTGLPGQLLLIDRLETALARARRGEGSPCLIIMDIDRFRAIIDALGIAAGDLLIVELARRLQSMLMEGETLARLPGDQFALIIDAERHGTSLAFVRRIHEMLNEPFDLDGEEATISVSIGVVDLVAAMALSAREAVRAAEIAMFEARRSGPGNEAFYTPDMHGEHARLAKLEQELRRALKTGELEVHYQPIMWLGSHMLAGFEALLRWRHPERGIVGPEAFIGLAEEIGMVRELGHFVLREVVRQLGVWQRTFRTEHPFHVAVNIASTDLLDETLAEEVSELLARENADAAGLKLEVTETLLLKDPAATRTTLQRLRELGVGIVCDDFGTGYSSLSRLRALPFEALKIDRSFLAHDDPASRSVIAAIIELAHGLSMRVIGEGVEEDWQLQVLEGLGCDMAQGYLLAQELDVAEISRCMTEARRIAPLAGRLAALSHILFNDAVAPPLPEDVAGAVRREDAATSAGTPDGAAEKAAVEDASAEPAEEEASEKAPEDERRANRSAAE